ncbi:hypothetical protein OCGS_0933 [Oceaniovalibus guishaninsula JLT2003]|uniref:TIGR02587 family membrane protein n=1 Tax=Oceaniovalibus guishaninsula JLT2003 TaxID=1231392 RepID=K2HBM6_9RHOB|nr:TIGR02587 family membrane protein [Oceaniovalibus guishaninsula]EKE44898.1 hypothetical protein OCGS_0933 [Oceaniovalibus guishaninsula JLT2003]
MRTSQDMRGEAAGQSPRAFMVDVGRAGAGSLLFSLPILMTMEMWDLGFLIGAERLALLFVVLPILLTGLSRVGGFRLTATLGDDIADAFVAIAVALVVSTAILLLFGLIGPDVPLHESVGKVMIQTVPGSIGAMLAQNQFDSEAVHYERDQRGQTYGGQIFLMVVGAIFLSLSVAPTDEIVVLAHEMGVGHDIATVLFTLLLMHVFVYSLEIRGSKASEIGRLGARTLFFRYTVVGYALVLCVSLYLLWTFGRIDNASVQTVISLTAIVAIPGGIGAAVARLIL